MWSLSQNTRYAKCGHNYLKYLESLNIFFSKSNSFYCDDQWPTEKLLKFKMKFLCPSPPISSHSLINTCGPADFCSHLHYAKGLWQLPFLSAQAIAFVTKKEICSWWELSFNDAETKLFLNLKYIKDSSISLTSYFSQLSMIVYQILYFESQNLWKKFRNNLLCIYSLLATGKVIFLSDCELSPPPNIK